MASALNLPGHRQKVADILGDQIMRQSFFVSAFGVGDPPQAGKITD